MDLVVLAGRFREAGCLAVVTAGAPPREALVVQVVQERSQDLPGGRQSGIEVSLELFGRLLALRPGDLAEYLSRLFVRIWQRSWLDRVVSHRRPATAVRVVAAVPDVDHPPGGGPLMGGPRDPSIASCDHFVGPG